MYDEEGGEWVKKWGYKGANKKDEGQWLVELDDEKVGRENDAAKGQNVRMEGRRERKERIKRQDRRQRSNEKRVRKGR